MQEVINFLMAHLEYSPILLAPVIFLFLKKNKKPKTRNDVTQYLVKLKRQNEAVNQQAKGMFTK